MWGTKPERLLHASKQQLQPSLQAEQALRSPRLQAGPANSKLGTPFDKEESLRDKQDYPKYIKQMYRNSGEKPNKHRTCSLCHSQNRV